MKYNYFHKIVCLIIRQKFSELIWSEIIVRFTTRDNWWLETSKKYITVRLYDVFHLRVNWRGTKMENRNIITI